MPAIAAIHAPRAATAVQLIGLSRDGLDVLACYYFDKDLKTLLFKAIQTIEVAVRSKIIKHVAPTCGPFWFMDATKAVNQKRFQINLDTIKMVRR